MHSPAHRKHATEHLSSTDLGHWDPEIFIKACDFESSFVEQCFDFDIPYGGGISVCGKWYFQDRSIPKYFYDSGDSKAYTPTDSPSDPAGNPCWYLPRFWMVHERVEFSNEVDSGLRRRDFISMKYMQTRDIKWVIGVDDHFNYEPAHQIAEGTEERLVTALGLDLKRYVKMCDGLIEIAYFKVPETCPANLYLQPYEDPGDDDKDSLPDMDSLKAIVKAGGPKSYLLYGVGERGGHDGVPFWGA